MFEKLVVHEAMHTKDCIVVEGMVYFLQGIIFKIFTGDDTPLERTRPRM